MPTNEDELLRRVRESFRTMTDEESDAIWEEMIRDGIIDRDGKVLVRMPEGPPEWARSTSNGKPTNAATKRPKGQRKTS
jgi:hypothetical protein